MSLGPRARGILMRIKSKDKISQSRWSVHDLRLLHEDAVEGAAEPLSDEELLRLAKLAHLDIEGGNFDRTALRRDVGAIMNCMALLQTTDLHDVSKQDMYAPATGGKGSARLREDVVTEGGPKMQAQVLENAQETAHGQFVVPLVNRKS
ncbi:hypothetical protein NSK_004873 [Nannochloropsis salina CCMP1776]|uniref:Aspartyl/glutamyl-tRNA(Asn/Gln) amidotransferase subunit C n=1 Tax=Nannochloropsis salina CCMP1776 TaxID=1027361 RepID=A0A4D9CX21_9STRA|nr:hypothetical protein NSK_004873 [Nannochloropsis salina CCMP1776]|eukprot:TFJ83770.1 hypothetical protein NSK_004873 [Nannochloropsis salina CCMP1776]